MQERMVKVVKVKLVSQIIVPLAAVIVKYELFKVTVEFKDPLIVFIPFTRNMKGVSLG